MDFSSKKMVLPKHICQTIFAGYKTKRPTSKPHQPPLPDTKN